jgi:hypothetical protein
VVPTVVPRGTCKSKCTRVDCISIVIVLFSIVLNSHFLILLSKSSLVYVDENDYLSILNNRLYMNASTHHIGRCVPVKNFLYEFFLLHSWFWIDLCLMSILPFVTMVVCSAFIIVKLKTINRAYMARLVLSREQNVLVKRIYSRKLRKNIQISLVLVSSNLYFLATMIIFWLWFLCDDYQVASFESGLKQSFVYLLLYSNNASGILFYIFSSEQFRCEFLRIFCKIEFKK